MSGKPALRVALPWLHEARVEARAAEALPPLPAFAWLVGHGVTTRAAEGEWREWLLAAAEAGASESLQRWPAGPSMAAATVQEGPARGWAIAQPVHFAAGMDHVRLAALADATPNAQEAGQLTATLNGHFADDGLEFIGPVEGAWLVRSRDPLACTSHDPASVVGRNVHDFLPDGPDGARVRSLMNEIQMLLHEHPVNRHRASTRALSINGLWLWGFGAGQGAAATSLASTARWSMYSDDLWLRAFWRAHGGRVREVGEMDVATAGDALVAVTLPPAHEPSAALLEADARLLAPLRDRVRAGGVRSLDLFDGARVYTLDAYTRWRLWRRPAAPDEGLS